MKTEDDFDAMVYNPEPEAKALLEKHDSLTVVKGLLNQLTACRQTNAINEGWNDGKCEVLESENAALREALKKGIDATTVKLFNEWLEIARKLIEP